MGIDWKEYKRQREDVTREDEDEFARAFIKFIGRFLWAKISGKKVVKMWFTDTDGDDMFMLCVRSEEVVQEDTICYGCFTKRKAGTEMSRLKPLLTFEMFDDEDMSEIMCKECADMMMDKERYKECEGKREEKTDEGFKW